MTVCIEYVVYDPVIGEVRRTIEEIEKEYYDKFGYDKYGINYGYDVNMKSSVE